MYKFFQRNQKKLLAVFGVVLMVTFLMPTFRTASQTRGDQVAGTIGSETISRDDVDRAEAEWQFLIRRVMVRTNEPGPNQWRSVILEVPEFRILATQLQENPQGYYLLQYDAKRLGYAPQYERAEALLKDPSDSVAIAMPDDRIIPWNQLGNDENTQAMAKQSVADLLMVMSVFERARDAVKVSEPLIKHELAGRYQQIKSRVVDFTVQDNLRNVPTPSVEDLQKHFQAFASVESGVDKGPKNPFGFGYKYPDRVKVQYIGIPRTEIRKAVQAQKSDYDWDKEGHMYYLQHQSEFPTTQPATTQETLTLGPSTRPGPSTRLYEEVKQTIMDRMIEPLANRLGQQIQGQITSRLNQDYQSYAKTVGPTSSPTGAAYESFEYLQKLAAEIENRYHVTLTVASVADAFRDRLQLAELPGIGKILKFPDYAMTAVHPLTNTQLGTIPASIKLFEPSKPLVAEEGIGDVYFFRVIAVDPAHQPASMDEVKDRVEQDWKKNQAYELAKADAKKLLEAARMPGLDVAASSDQKVVTTGFYSTSTMMPIENYRISTTSQAEFVKQTFALLPVLTEKDHGRPMTTVEMPADGKVAVAELIAVEAGLNPQSLEVAKLLMGDQVAQPYAMSVMQDWFDYNNVVQRLGFKDRTKSKDTE